MRAGRRCGRMFAMSDIIERIKGLRYVHVPQASQLFEEAIAEIERLRLTADERQAIRWIVGDDLSADGVNIQATLRGLLERTKTL